MQLNSCLVPVHIRYHLERVFILYSPASMVSNLTNEPPTKVTSLASCCSRNQIQSSCFLSKGFAPCYLHILIDNHTFAGQFRASGFLQCLILRSEHPCSTVQDVTALLSSLQTAKSIQSNLIFYFFPSSSSSTNS